MDMDDLQFPVLLLKHKGDPLLHLDIHASAFLGLEPAGSLAQVTAAAQASDLIHFIIHIAG